MSPYLPPLPVEEIRPIRAPELSLRHTPCGPPCAESDLDAALDRLGGSQAAREHVLHDDRDVGVVPHFDVAQSAVDVYVSQRVRAQDPTVDADMPAAR